MELQNLPVYKFFLTKQVDALLSMSLEQQQEAMQKHDEFLAQVGGKVLLIANCSWSNEEFDMFGFEEFPNLEAVIEFNDCLKSLNWFYYLPSKTYLGLSIDATGKPVEVVAPPLPMAGSQPIYKAFLARPTPLGMGTDAWNTMGPLNEKLNASAHAAGMIDILGAYTRFNNEEWMLFGLERYPDITAFYDKYLQMENLGWYKYMQAKSYLGRAVGGTFTGMTG